MIAAKTWMAIAAALGAATWIGVKAGAFSILGEARAERPPVSSCRCPPGDLMCALDCSTNHDIVGSDPRPAELPKARAPEPAPPLVKAMPEQPAQEVTASIVRLGSEPARIVVSRPGHIVALSQGVKRTVGSASAGVLLTDILPEGRAQPESPAEIIWETTRLGTSAIERGTLRLVDERGAVGVTLSESPPPSPVRVDKRALHTCASYRDAQSGFTVVCQLDKAAWRVGVANLTGEKPSQDVLATPGEAPTVRLDLPLVRGGAEARLLGYINGSKGIAIRAEASWIEGEDEPSITLGVVERPDSSFGFLFSDPRDWRRRPIPFDGLDFLL